MDQHVCVILIQLLITSFEMDVRSPRVKFRAVTDKEELALSFNSWNTQGVLDVR